jgi:hypothetical protein
MNAVFKSVSLIDAEILAVFNQPTHVLRQYGIAKNVVETGETPKEYPAILTVDNQIQAAIDDNYTICTWHKINSQRAVAVEDGFGDANSDKEIDTSMSMVIWANLERLGVNESQLGSLFFYSIPNILNVGINGVYFTDVDTSNVDYDSQTIFSREFKGIDYNISIGSTLIQIDYTITMQFSKSCVAQCTTC